MKVAVIIPNYNGAALVVRTVNALLRQTLPEECSLEIIIVDDGSTDDSVESIRREFSSPPVQLVALDSNRGRSTARNAGAYQARAADLLVFVDSDCIPVGNSFLSAHVAALRRGVLLSFGNITTPGPGFWDRLQRNSAKWRLKALHSGQLWAFTTQNVAIQRLAFEAVRGFDPIFDRFGFEDRDLFIKLAARGFTVDFTPDAAVVHADSLSLESVCRKLGQAGRYSAWEFDDLHPSDYSLMHYSRIDCRRHPVLRHIDRIVWPLAHVFMGKDESWLEWEILPFRLRASLARLIYGLSFLHGTAERYRTR